MIKEHVSLCSFVLALYISCFSASYCIASGASYLLLLKFSNPKMSSSPMDWCLSLGFWEAGLKMAELILFTIHKKIRPYIPWEKIWKGNWSPSLETLDVTYCLLLCCQAMPENSKAWSPLSQCLSHRAPQPGRKTALKASPVFKQGSCEHQYLHKGILPIGSLNHIQRPGHTFSSDNDAEVCEAVLEFTRVHLEKQSWQPGHSRWTKEIQQSLYQEEDYDKLLVWQHPLATCCSI